MVWGRCKVLGEDQRQCSPIGLHVIALQVWMITFIFPSIGHSVALPCIFGFRQSTHLLVYNPFPFLSDAPVH